MLNIVSTLMTQAINITGYYSRALVSALTGAWSIFIVIVDPTALVMVGTAFFVSPCTARFTIANWLIMTVFLHYKGVLGGELSRKQSILALSLAAALYGSDPIIYKTICELLGNWTGHL